MNRFWLIVVPVFASLAISASLAVSASLAMPAAPSSRPATAPVLGAADLSTRPVSSTSRPALLRAFTPAAGTPETGYVLYLSGISNYRRLDRGVLRGLVAAQPGLAADVYTWSAYDPGLGALFAIERNRREALVVTGIIERAVHDHPDRPVYLLAHSGGAGIAVWALEALSPNVSVEQLILLAPALSPAYDLRPAMRRVRGSTYAFTSRDDPVLGLMTRTFGTIDRIKSDAAGLNGFVLPAGAPEADYRKLVPMPYRPEWERLGHDGDHIGSLRLEFARSVLAPLLSPVPRAAK